MLYLLLLCLWLYVIFFFEKFNLSLGPSIQGSPKSLFLGQIKFLVYTSQVPSQRFCCCTCCSKKGDKVSVSNNDIIGQFMLQVQEV